jgi:hypothetical protein
MAIVVLSDTPGMTSEQCDAVAVAAELGLSDSLPPRLPGARRRRRPGRLNLAGNPPVGERGSGSG